MSRAAAHLAAAIRSGDVAEIDRSQRELCRLERSPGNRPGRERR